MTVASCDIGIEFRTTGRAALDVEMIYPCVAAIARVVSWVI